MVAENTTVKADFAGCVGKGAVDSTLTELVVGRLDYAGDRR